MILVAANDARERRRQTAGFGHSVRRGTRRGRIPARYPRDKAVPAAGVICDVAPAGAAIAERLAQRRDMDPEGGLFDNRVPAMPRAMSCSFEIVSPARSTSATKISERAAAEAQRFAVLEGGCAERGSAGTT